MQEAKEDYPESMALQTLTLKDVTPTLAPMRKLVLTANASINANLLTVKKEPNV